MLAVVLDELMQRILDAELDIRYLDALLAMRGERKAADPRGLRRQRAYLVATIERAENALDIRLANAGEEG